MPPVPTAAIPSIMTLPMPACGDGPAAANSSDHAGATGGGMLLEDYIRLRRTQA